MENFNIVLMGAAADTAEFIGKMETCDQEHRIQQCIAILGVTIIRDNAPHIIVPMESYGCIYDAHISNTGLIHRCGGT